jgi:hypothetical protein
VPVQAAPESVHPWQYPGYDELPQYVAGQFVHVE